MNKYFLVSLGFVLSMITILSSCTSNADSPGLEYMPDMYRSPAIEAYVDYGEVRGRINDSLKLRLTAMTPPENSVPYYATEDRDLMLPYKRLPSVGFRKSHGLYGMQVSANDEYVAASADLLNPLTLNAGNSEAILGKGKTLYTSMCSHCHGEKGDGNGPMVVNGYYNGVPAYNAPERVALSNGQIFYSIYYGKGMMGGHGSLLNKKEIWTLVHYVRSFQDPNYGKFGANGQAMASKSDTIKSK